MIRSSASRNTIWLPTGGLSRCACSSIHLAKLKAASATLSSPPARWTSHSRIHKTRMNLAPRSIADVLVLAPAGRLDHESVDAFRTGLQPQLDTALQAGRGVLFDLSGLDYVSSAGLRCFMLAA